MIEDKITYVRPLKIKKEGNKFIITKSEMDVTINVGNRIMDYCKNEDTKTS